MTTQAILLVPMKPKRTGGTLVWGALFLVLGLGMLYYYGYVPWRDGGNQELKISLSFKALLVAPTFVILGFLCLLPLHRGTEPAAGESVLMSVGRWTFLILLVLSYAGAIGYYFWLRAFLQGQGYDV